MSRSPSIVPDNIDRDIYIVMDDFGLQAQVWRETNDAEADRATLIHDLLDGQYEAPIRIVAFNTAQGWSRDVTKEIASELRQHCADRGEIPPACMIFWRSTAAKPTATAQVLGTKSLRSSQTLCSRASNPPRVKP